MLKVSKVKKIYLALGLFLAFGAFIFAYDSIREVSAAPDTTINPGGGGGIPLPAGVPLEVGDVYGWAWTGQNIIPGSEVSEGGGGWLKLNCKPNDCGPAGATGDWGTTINLVRDQNFGNFMGQGWSSYYGWLSFESNDVQSCWQNNPLAIYQGPAKAMLDDAGPWVDVVGWGKFIAGDVDNDGWDGCVSFNGVNHDVEVNLTTGVIRGWAWGGSVTGWVSFTNPECPFCNTGIVLEGSTSIAFWADDTTNPANGSTTLRWEATNAPPNYVANCTQYSNTSNYSHWTSTGVGTALNVGPINTTVGNLPTGSHLINGVTAPSTTYSLSCKDRNNNTLPTQYVTITNTSGLCTTNGAINIGQPLPCVFPNPGMCLDPAPNVINFGQPLPCIYDNPPPDDATISLDVSPTIFYDNAANFNVSLDWYSPDNLDTCFGRFNIGGTQTPLAGWSGAKADPDVYGFTGQNTAFNNLLSSATAPQTYTFRISCLDNDGNPVVDTATVNLLPYVPSFEAPEVRLRIMDPEVQPAGTQVEDISPYPAQNPANITLEWDALNVNGCVASSDIYDIVNNVATGPFSTNLEWNTTSITLGTNNEILDVIGQDVRKPTKFFVTCTADDPNYTGGNVNPPSNVIRREVCLGINGTTFPACSVTGSGQVPSYQEI